MGTAMLPKASLWVLAVLAAVAVAAPVFESDVVFLDEHKGSSMEARAAALAKVKALIAPVKAPDAGTISKLQAELKKATAQAAKYKLLAASATKRESIRLHSKLTNMSTLPKESLKLWQGVHLWLWPQRRRMLP